MATSRVYGTMAVEEDREVVRWLDRVINAGAGELMKSRIWLALAYSIVLAISIQGQGECEPSDRKTGDTATFNLPGGATMEMVWIEPGTFMMGTTEEQRSLMILQGVWLEGYFKDELPAHRVKINRGFYLGKYELMQEQWESVMGMHPWDTQEYIQSDPNHPAVYISWEDVQAFIVKLNQAEGKAVYRLPTEAEWEYACRAGTTTRWSFGDNESQLGDYAWYNANACAVGECYAHAVGIKLSNPWGLYDMHGNAWEWVEDRYGEYTSDSQIDPTGSTTGSHRVLRGGAYQIYAASTRSAYRADDSQGSRSSGFSARLLRQEP